MTSNTLPSTSGTSEGYTWTMIPSTPPGTSLRQPLWALSIQVLLEAVDGNAKEMVDLCRELLTSNITADFPVATFMKLRQAVDVEYV